MDDQQSIKKMNKDVNQAKKDLGILADDGADQLNRLEDKISQAANKAKDDVTSWVEDGASKLNHGFEKMKVDVKEKAVDVAKSVKQDVEHGLSTYNAKVQDVADRVPGGFSEKAAKYPWVAISAALVAGYLLGGLLKPGRKDS